MVVVKLQCGHIVDMAAPPCESSCQIYSSASVGTFFWYLETFLPSQDHVHVGFGTCLVVKVSALTSFCVPASLQIFSKKMNKKG